MSSLHDDLIGDQAVKKFSAVLLLVLTPHIAFGADPVTVVRAIPYADGIGTDDIRKECDWNAELPAALGNYYRDGVVLVDELPVAPDTTTLWMQITAVHAAGGGNFSGPKWAIVQGELRKGGQVLGSFEAGRGTSGGGFRFTACSVLSGVGKAIAKDIGVWLKNPTMNARLGNAK